MNTKRHDENDYSCIKVKISSDRASDISSFAKNHEDSVDTLVDRALFDLLWKEFPSHFLSISEQIFWEWRKTASDEERSLFEKMYTFQDLFADMLFEKGSITYQYGFANLVNGETGPLCSNDLLPEILKEFKYNLFTYHIKEMKELKAYARFNFLEGTFSVSPEHLNDDATILHEMIHLHESIVNTLPNYYREIILFSLYQDLHERIPDLDDRVKKHGHIPNQQYIGRKGGVHDILFFLKSLDLDLKMGFDLGKIFGYGYNR